MPHTGGNKLGTIYRHKRGIKVQLSAARSGVGVRIYRGVWRYVV